MFIKSTFHLSSRSLLRRSHCLAREVSTSSATFNDNKIEENVEEKLTNRLKCPQPFMNYSKQCENLKHFSNSSSLVVVRKEEDYTLPHPIWTNEEMDQVEVTHRKPEGITDNLAYLCVGALRLSFDLFSGYKIQLRLGTLDEKAVLTRCIFLETVAGVPGFAAGMIRHLQSLRKMERDHGWIHTLIEEAENERMHLMTFLQLRHPGPFFKSAVILTQCLFTVGFSMAYLVSPHFCHRFVGYLEEQAVVTYSDILQKMDEGKLPMWSRLPAPELAVKYWKLGEGALMREVILAIRADEAHHRVVNHTLGDMDLKEKNPFKPGE